MLQVVQLEGEKGYYLQNTWTGIILREDDGSLRRFKKIRKAKRYARKIMQELNRTISRINGL